MPNSLIANASRWVASRYSRLSDMLSRYSCKLPLRSTAYTFRPRVVKNTKRNSLFVSFTPAVSTAALKAMRQRTRRLNYRNRTDLSLPDIARLHNPILRGWLEYYGRFCPSALYPVLRHFNKTLVAWAMRKYKRFKGHKTRASLFLEDISRQRPQLFVHWQRGMVGAFA